MGQRRILKPETVICRAVIVLACVLSAQCNDEGSDCFVKWVHGYRLASGRPQKILHSVSLEICKQECASTPGCAAFAYGTTRNNTSEKSSICELAINSKMRSSSKPTPHPPNSRTMFNTGSTSTRFFNYRDGRSVTTTSPDQNATSTTEAPTISISDLDRSPTYDVYIENPNSNEPCFKRDALYESSYPVGNQIGPDRNYPHFQNHQNGVPIDCFYRLMSGKRLVKTHTLRSISTNSLQECQEACIHERSFNCRSISYRYMPSSGYSYPVSNCELSSYYMQTGSLSSSYSKLDFVDDYDYDWYSREPHCKTTSSTTLGVCAVVVRRGGRVSTTLIKSSHNTVTSSQCEHLCATSLFRCRAFAFRHTTRGRDPYVSGRYPSSSPLTPTRDLPPPADHTCLLYDTDLMRLPSYNIEPDPDFDLFEMGRLMGAECVLYEQFLNRRPGYSPYSPGPVTSTMIPYPENRETGYYGDRYPGGGYQPNHGMGGNGASRERVDQHPHETGHGTNYLIERERESDRRYHSTGVRGEQVHVQGPPSTLETGLYNVRGSSGQGAFNGDSRGNVGGERVHVGGDRGGFSGDHRGAGSEFDRPANREEGRRPEANSYSNGTMSSGGGGSELPFYDKGKESCLRLYRQDSYLVPEVSRATFPVKTVDECRIECIRSLEVLRFPCRAMAYRHTSHSSLDRGSGGTCQLSDNDPREPDLVQARDRYENAVTFLYDDREPGCARGGGSGYYDRDRYGGAYGRDRYGSGYDDYNRNNYNNPPYNSYYSYDRSRQSSNNYYPPSDRYYDNRDYNRIHTPSNYNPHYWDYHNRHHGGGGGRYGDQYADRRHYGHYGQASNSYYDNDYPSGQGLTTVDGQRCLRGCRQNRETNFYYCQIDEQGAWDFCCRPDHFCGYSKGLSVPWCYVGTGRSQNIWRSCEAKGSRNNPFFQNSQRVEYLHAALPPTVHSLTNTEVANLTKDNAIRLFTNSTIEDVGSSSEHKFVAKQSNGSQEVIVRLSNSTSNASGEKGKKEGVSGKGKS